MSQIQFVHTYDDIISVENLLEAWKEFIRGKRKKADVQEFQLNLMDNILSLHHDLKDKSYRHGPYEAFNISDPKPRSIHKASVRDRLLHHALYRKLGPFFDRTFIADSYSCRRNKGTHKAMNSFRSFSYKVSKNHTRTCWVLKCDIRKFFATIDHEILLRILKTRIGDPCTIWLLERVIESFHTQVGKGLPLGNLTSQLLVNIYMNEFDQFVKHQLKEKYYIRYADDFVLLGKDKDKLAKTFRYIERFLEANLALDIHQRKTSIETYSSSVDFLGWVHFPTHRVLRTVTKRRMLKRIKETENEIVVQSYIGLLGHGNAKKLHQQIVKK